jgi:hypothetical protein
MRQSDEKVLWRVDVHIVLCRSYHFVGDCYCLLNQVRED